MKKTLLIALFLIVGCSKEPINIDTLVENSIGQFETRGDDDVYTDNTYSGPVFSLYDDGKKKAEGFLKSGWKDGKWTEWHENVQKKTEKSYNEYEPNGKMDFLV